MLHHPSLGQKNKKNPPARNVPSYTKGKEKGEEKNACYRKIPLNRILKKIFCINLLTDDQRRKKGNIQLPMTLHVFSLGGTTSVRLYTEKESKQGKIK